LFGWGIYWIDETHFALDSLILSNLMGQKRNTLTDNFRTQGFISRWLRKNQIPRQLAGQMPPKGWYCVWHSSLMFIRRSQIKDRLIRLDERKKSKSEMEKDESDLGVVASGFDDERLPNWDTARDSIDEWLLVP
jgi:hypothetical protein